MKSFKSFSEECSSSPPTNTDAGIAPSIENPPVGIKNKYKTNNEKNQRKIIGVVNGMANNS